MNVELAVSVRQPYTAALVHGTKPLENRTQPLFNRLRPGQWLAFHSAKTLYEMDERSWHWFHELWPDAPTTEDDPRMVKGAIVGLGRYVGTATNETLDRCVGLFPRGELRDARRWFGGPFAGLFDVRVPIATPIPCKGALGLWAVPEECRPALVAVVAKLGALPPIPSVPAWL